RRPRVKSVTPLTLFRGVDLVHDPPLPVELDQQEIVTPPPPSPRRCPGSPHRGDTQLPLLLLPRAGLEPWYHCAWVSWPSCPFFATKKSLASGQLLLRLPWRLGFDGENAAAEEQRGQGRRDRSHRFLLGARLGRATERDGSRYGRVVSQVRRRDRVNGFAPDHSPIF